MPLEPVASESEVWLLLLVLLGVFAVLTLGVVVRDLLGVAARIHGRPRPRPTIGGPR